MKFNYRNPIKLTNVVAILPQIHGGDINETRLYMSKNGIDVTIKKDEYITYLDYIRTLTQNERLMSISYYHALITIYSDALNYDYPPKSTIVGLYSLSNSINSRDKVLGFMREKIAAGFHIMVNFPAKRRIEYAVRNRIPLLSTFKMGTNMITFSSPSGKIWKDNCYTVEELHNANLTQVSPSVLRGILGPDYNGCGYFSKSTDSDMWDIFMSAPDLKQLIPVQKWSTSPASFIKAYTGLLRSLTRTTHGDYYLCRGLLAESYLRTAGIDNSAFITIGDEMKTLICMEDILLSTKYGQIEFYAGEHVNLSGHLLSIIVANHFTSCSVGLWLAQLIDVSRGRVRVHDKYSLEYFDMNISDKGVARWHSNSEVILTACIAKDYVKFILKDNYSEELVDDCLSVLTSILVSYP
ncbi:minor capsid protein [Halyomorpha halys reo-like associated virus 1]|nr:minor capsid protein [Halyomorpha halys reo-like associated virus 1]